MFFIFILAVKPTDKDDECYLKTFMSYLDFLTTPTWKKASLRQDFVSLHMQ